MIHSIVNALNGIHGGTFADPSTFLGAIIYAVVFGFVAWIAGRMLMGAVSRGLAHDKRALMDRTTVTFLAQLARMAVYVFAFICYARLVPPLESLGTAWLASVSVISVIFGLAAQNTLGNLIAGISLLIYRPFKIGDRLQVNAPTGLETGVVESLNLGYTLLKTDDGRWVILPNSIMASQTIVNLSGGDPRAVCQVAIRIGSAALIDKVRGILTEAAAQHPKVHRTIGCPLTQLEPTGMVLTLTVQCADAVTAGGVRCDLLESAIKRCASEGIEIPPPQAAMVLKEHREISR